MIAVGQKWITSCGSKCRIICDNRVSSLGKYRFIGLVLNKIDNSESVILYDLEGKSNFQYSDFDLVMREDVKNA